MKTHRAPYQVFIKPVSAICNLRCGYCYYNTPHVSNGGTGARVMEDSVLEEFTRQNIEASRGGIAYFAWHGGEPTLAGIDFYRRAVELQHKYANNETRIVNGIQTNGTLIDEDWCRFLVSANFAVGISLDGPATLHDMNRLDASGKGSFAGAESSFRMLKEHGLDPEVLCVVSATNVDYPLEVYRFFRELGASWMTFLPLVVRDNTATTGVTPASVPPEKFGIFLSRIFDEWVENDIERVRVQIFEEATRVAFNIDHTLCIFRRECGGVPVVESNGDFYPCDHFVTSERHAGNIMESGLEELLYSGSQRMFGKAKQDTLPLYCLDCKVLDMCNGECPRNRFAVTPDGECGLNYLCAGYRLFFNHIRPFVEAVRSMK